MGGGERAPVALCREPTDAAAETRGWAALIQRKAPGEIGRGPTTRLGKPALKSRSLRRDFIAPRGHAPRSALCGGIFLPPAGTRLC